MNVGGGGLSRPPNKPRAGNGVTLRNIRQLRGVTAVSLDGHLMHVQLEALPPAPSPRRHARGVGRDKGAVHMSLDLSRFPVLPQLASVSEPARARGTAGRDFWGTGLGYSSPRQKKPRAPPLPSTWQPQPPSSTHATRTPRDVQALHGGDSREATSVLTEPDVRQLVVDAEDASFGDQLTTRMVLEHWRRGFNFSQPSNSSFSSIALYIETRLHAGLREAAGWEQPSALRTIVALSCLDLLIVHTGALRSVLTTIRSVLLSALCTDAHGGRRKTFPPPTADVAPAWLLDARFYFQDSGDEQKVAMLEQRLKEEGKKTEQIRTAVVMWQHGIVMSYFAHWRDKVKFFGGKRKVMATFLQRWRDEGPGLRETFTEWWQLIVRSRFKHVKSSERQHSMAMRDMMSDVEYYRQQLEQYSQLMYSAQQARDRLEQENVDLNQQVAELSRLVDGAKPRSKEVGSQVDMTAEAAQAKSVHMSRMQSIHRASVLMRRPSPLTAAGAATSTAT